MPRFNVRTVSGKQIWASPDGQRKIFEVTLDVGGKQVTAKTYSGAIAEPGWSGEVDTYEKENRSGGADTFVKQPPKEGGGYSGGSGGHSGTTGRGTPKDEAAIKAMWAIGQSVQMLKISDAALDAADVKALARTMFDMVEEVKTGQAVEQSAPQADPVYTDIPDDITVEDLGTKLDVGETPWPGN